MVAVAVTLVPDEIDAFPPVADVPLTVKVYVLPLTASLTEDTVAEFLVVRPLAVYLTVDLPLTINWLSPVIPVTLVLVS